MYVTASPKRISLYLFVIGGIPVWVEEDESVAAYKIQATSSCLGAEQEDKLLLRQVVEGHHQFLALVEGGGSIQT